MLAKYLFESQIIAPDVYDFQALLEDRIDFIKNKYKGSLDAMVDHIANHVDPTKNKKYTEWLVQRHLKGDDVLHPDVKEHLKAFERAKSTAHDTNIKNHTLESLRDVAHMVGSPTVKPTVSSLNQIYSKDGVHGFSIPDKATSIALYGPGRKFSANWCTSTPTGNNRFDMYGGGKYTMHFPNGHFMQIHHESGQAKDPSNDEINFDTDERYKPYRAHIHEFMKQTADLDNETHSMPERHFGIDQSTFEEHYKDYKEHGYNSSFLKHAEQNKLSDDMFSTLMHKGWISKVSRNPNLDPHHVDALVDHYSKHPDQLTTAFFENPQVKGHHLHGMMDTFSGTAAASNIRRMYSSPNLDHSHIDRLMGMVESNGKDAGVAHAALSNIIGKKYHFNDDQIHSMYRHGIELHEEIGEHQTLPDSLREKAFRTTLSNVRHGYIGPKRLSRFIKHQDLKADELHELMDSAEVAERNSDAYMAATTNSPHFNSTHLKRLASHINKQEDVSDDVVSSEKIPHEVIKDWMQSTPPSGRRHTGYGFARNYLSRSDASAKLLHEALNKHNPSGLGAYDLNDMGFHDKKDLPKELLKDRDHSPYIAKSILHHPNYTKDDLHDLLDGIKEWGDFHRSNPSSTVMNNIMSHPNANPSHFHRILDTWGHDWMVRESVQHHPNTPPSVHHRLMTTDFEDKE